MLENLPVLWKKLSAEALICGNWKAHNNLRWIKVPAQLNASTDSPRWTTIGHMFKASHQSTLPLTCLPSLQIRLFWGCKRSQPNINSWELHSISQAPSQLSKPTEHSSWVNLPVTCTEETGNSSQSYSWHVGYWPYSHQLPTRLLKGSCRHSEQASLRLSHLPTLTEKVLYSTRALRHVESCDPLWKKTPLPKQTSPAAAPAHHRPTASLRQGKKHQVGSIRGYGCNDQIRKEKYESVFEISLCL